MVYVDFGNSFLRGYLPEFLATHKKRLGDLAQTLPRMAAASGEQERVLALQLKREARRLAVVFDIDEVILSNIYQNKYEDEVRKFYAADYFTAPDEKTPWPRDEPLAPALPGAIDLLVAARNLGLEVVLISGRAEPLRAETVANLKKLGLVGDTPQQVFLEKELSNADHYRLTLCPVAELPKADGSIRPFKEARRLALSATHRIVLNVGDQASDLGDHADNTAALAHMFYTTL